jgi:glycosyltransferase involved in cell wall biosynthesis
MGSPMADTMKIGIVATSFLQNGAERFAFEHALYLRSKGMDVHIMTATNSAGYYLDRLIQEGFPIHRVLSRRILLSSLGIEKLTERLAQIAGYCDAASIQRHGMDFLILMEIGNYNALRWSRYIREHSITMLMSHQFQYSVPLYAHVRPPFYCYTFDTRQANELTAARIQYEGPSYPLPIDMKYVPRVRYARDPTRIAYLSRLHPHRPIEFFFFAFQQIRKRIPDATLHIFGRGTLSLEQARLLTFLGIQDKVVFEGHAADLQDALKQCRPSVAWLPCMGTILGYISIELLAMEIPTVFWNLDSSVHDLIWTGSHDLCEFVDLSERLMTDDAFMEQVRDRHAYEVRARHAIENVDALLQFLHKK